ncbi:MAG: TetR/AcrR family transcriptional regulator [Ruminococcaceae bacterium]|nr:TetR/AcrR family transcriptional regulator [Oscillospiraceae bacterium]
MPRVGLNKKTIVDAAVKLMEEKGYEEFSLRILADSLNVKTASLYNHISGMDELIANVGEYAVGALNEAQYKAIEDLQKREAILALALAYRRYAKEHPEMYKVVMSLYKTKKEIIERSAVPVPAPFMQVLGDYPLDEKEKMHWQRVLRSILHGFLSQDEAGYFCHFPIDENESYVLGIDCFIDGLEAYVYKKEQFLAEKERKEAFS